MQPRILTTWLLLLLLAHGAAGSQTTILPTPRPSRDAQGNYVFRWTDTTGTAREFLLVPGGKIAVTIAGRVSRSDAGVYAYHYAIANERSAAHKMSDCYIEVAMPARVVGVPDGWEAFQPVQIAPRAAWFKSGFIDGVPDGVEPGSVVTGFVIESTSLPGVTEFTCSGNVTPSAPPQDLPPALEQELERLPIGMSRVIKGIGPAIERPDDPLPVLVRRVVRNYRLALRSAFGPDGAAAVKALDGVAGAANSSTGDLRTAVSELASVLATTPDDPWAQQVAQALEECLQHVLTRLTASR